MSHITRMKYMSLPRKQGFTLVELLVVIVIIAALAAVAFTVAPRMMQKAKATEAMQNMQQLGPLLAAYAVDHEMKLPPAKGPATLSDGTTTDLQWNEICLALLYPGTAPAEFKTESWWVENKPILGNPLFPKNASPRGRTPLNPGYGLNEMIPENLALSATGTIPSHEELLAISVPLAALGDPGRTPLIAPCDNYFFRYDEAQLGNFNSGTLKELLNDGKFPLLFVDGHIEAISPGEYLERKLFLVPIVAIP